MSTINKIARQRLGMPYPYRAGPKGDKGENGVNSFPIETCDFTYVGDLVTLISYADGQSKAFTYNDDNTVHMIVWDRLVDIVTKTFTYVGGLITHVEVSIV